MPAQTSFDYAIIRVVPRVDRGECLNAGVLVFCLQEQFLEARVELELKRLDVFSPLLDHELVRLHLDAFPRICAGLAEAGPIAQLSLRERFHWLVAPRSTVIQVSAVHSGLCESPEAALEELFRSYVLL